MVNQALIDVVKNQLAGGISEQEVREFLRRRGTGEAEIGEIFEILSAEITPLADIPVAEPAVVASPEPLSAPVAEPMTTVAHGIEREVPPLQPSAPFAPVSADLQPSLAAQPISGGIVLPPASNRKKMVLVIGTIVGILALLIGGGAYLYSAYFVSPDKVMDRMIFNLRDVRSAAFSLEVRMTTSEVASLVSSTSTAPNPFLSMFAAQQGPVSSTLTASGAFDLLEEANPKVSVAFGATMDKWPLGDFALGAEYRNLDRKNYIKVNDVPDLGFFSLAFLKNKWFMIDDKDAKSQLGSSQGSSDTIIPAVTQDQRDRLADAWQDNRFLIVDKKLATQEIDGVATHHYGLIFDKEAYRAWLIATDGILQQDPVDQAELDATLDALTVSGIEIWIGKRDGLPHKFTIQASMRGDGASKGDVTISVTGTGKGFGEPQSIVAPEGVQSFEAVLQGIFGQMLGEGAPKADVPVTPQARNEQRRKDIAVIADAIRQNMRDNGGTFTCSAGAFPQKATFLGAAGFGMTGYAIESCLVPKYLSEMPKDPTQGGLGMTGYSAYYDPKTKKITVRAPYAEAGAKITITK